MGHWCGLPYISSEDIGNIFPYYCETGTIWRRILALIDVREVKTIKFLFKLIAG